MFSLEIIKNIVKYVQNRTDVAHLCLVAKDFQRVAERSLYNTLILTCPSAAAWQICSSLSSSPRIAELVDALTLQLYTSTTPSSQEGSQKSGVGSRKGSISLLPTVAQTLKNTKNLRYLNVYTSDTSLSWLLDGCTFQLHHLSVELDWDSHLVDFLNTQSELKDLYLGDYLPLLGSPSDGSRSPSPHPNTHLTLIPNSIPNLHTLECQTMEATFELMPGRPIRRLKTACAGQTVEERKLELTVLFQQLSLIQGSLRSLSLMDIDPSPRSTKDVLSAVMSTRSTRELRYLGTLVLPVDGAERLKFYTLLMGLPRLRYLELDVSHWEPSPNSFPALRSLASELRIYVPRIHRIVFLLHNTEPTVLSITTGMWKMDKDPFVEHLWREVQA